jgi:hypothetical protein
MMGPGVGIDRARDLGPGFRRLHLGGGVRGPKYDLLAIPAEPDGDDPRRPVHPDVSQLAGSRELSSSWVILSFSASIPDMESAFCT